MTSRKLRRVMGSSTSNSIARRLVRRVQAVLHKEEEHIRLLQGD